jgi:predicted glycoside hydrolase/deacetylase ChbG (UPF0249 family)
MIKTRKFNNLTGWLLFPFIALLFTGSAEKARIAEPANWAEKLDFPAGKKVIILHADDAGLCEEANTATAHYLENGLIQSASIMVPCPAADEFIQWAMDQPDQDIGLHLTHTSEWKTYRWGPVSDPNEVPGLIDPDGMLWHEIHQVVMHASAEEVEKEIRAQIERSLSLGYRPDHIDTHMGTLYGHASYLEVFLRVAEEYGIPATVTDLSNSMVVKQFIKQGYPIDDNIIDMVNKYTLPKVDFFTSVPGGSSYEEKIENFKTLIRTLPPGLTEIYFHPSVETERLKTITNSWQQRVWEAEMFSDPDLVRFYEEEGILFTNWKEIMNRHNAI